MSIFVITIRYNCDSSDYFDVNLHLSQIED